MRLPFRHSDLSRGGVVYRITRLSGTALSMVSPWNSLPNRPACRYTSGAGSVPRADGRTVFPNVDFPSLVGFS